LTKAQKVIKISVQSESVTLSVDYLISSTQAGHHLLGFFYHLKTGLDKLVESILIILSLCTHVIIAPRNRPT